MTPEHKFALLTTFGPAVMSAIIAAIVSWLVTRSILKHSPDYQHQLDALRTEMGQMTQVQRNALAHQQEVAADEQNRREAAQWHPDAHLTADPQTLSNTLHIASNKPMRLERVDLLTTSGVLVKSLPVAADPGAMAHRLDFVIPAAAILILVTPDPDYLLYQKTTGRIRYVLSVGVVSTTQTFELPFRVTQDITNSNVWSRMEG